MKNLQLARNEARNVSHEIKSLVSTLHFGHALFTTPLSKKIKCVCLNFSKKNYPLLFVEIEIRNNKVGKISINSNDQLLHHTKKGKKGKIFLSPVSINLACTPHSRLTRCWRRVGKEKLFPSLDPLLWIHSVGPQTLKFTRTPPPPPPPSLVCPRTIQFILDTASAPSHFY